MFVNGAPVGDPEQPPLRVELVEQPVEVALVDAAPVVQDERALWLALGLAEQVNEAQPTAQARRAPRAGL